MDDLIERLHDMADMRHMDRGYDAVDDIMREAAEALSAKDAEIARQAVVIAEVLGIPLTRDAALNESREGE